jgi:hypothetical protein
MNAQKSFKEDVIRPLKNNSKKISTFNRFENLQDYQHLENYQIKILPDSESRGNLCVIYCSSHGIYPDRKSAFHKHILKEDRYEWKRNMIKKAKKSIFVRDLKKQWYLEGINPSINSLSKLLDFLRKETVGMNLICIGNSAGGYLATLLGCELKASHVFSFSGQFSLYPYLANQKNSVLLKYQKTQLSQSFYSLSSILKLSQVPIFYLYPSGSQSDQKQVVTLKDLPNIYKIPFKESEHGKTCFPINFLNLFRMDVSELKSLSEEFSDGVHPIWFSIKVSGYKDTFKFFIKQKFKLFQRYCRFKIQSFFKS